MTRLPTALRSLALALGALALVGSASSRSSAPPPQPAGGWNTSPPQSQGMDPRAAHGLWKTTFGAVKIEEEGPSRVHGAWTYDNKEGQQVIGYFSGALDGNVLRLSWREPAQPVPGVPVMDGEGWLVFDPGGARFTGRWWTRNHDRQGDWSGWRQGQTPPAGVPPQYDQPPPPVGGAYGGDGYGGDGYGGAPTYPPPPPPAGQY